MLAARFLFLLNSNLNSTNNVARTNVKILFLNLAQERSGLYDCLKGSDPQIKCRVNRGFHTCLRDRGDDKRDKTINAPRRDEGVEGERAVDIDGKVTKSYLFPDERTPDMLFEGVRFADLPICHVKSSRNNTIMLVTNHKGEPVVGRSCGTEGFKNAKKGTNIAAQATGISIGIKTLEKGIKNIRIKVQGLGPGRMASVKGLQMAGLNIVSISDDTPVSDNPPRPRKQRRL